VDWCTKTPKFEKVAREAVRKMFLEMKPLRSQDGLQHVRKSDFSQSASQVAANKTEMKLLMKAGTVQKYCVVESLYYSSLAYFQEYTVMFCQCV